MESTNKTYDFNSSLERIDDILSAKKSTFKEKESIPSRSDLTFTNGFYVNYNAIYEDIIDSSSLPEKQNRPVLEKIYRSFISEMVALMNGNELSKEVNINGDCVWCVCDTPYKKDIDDVFCLAAQVCSLVDVLNYKLQKKGYQSYRVGVGIDYGRALMIKAGHSGSSINDVVWMGDVVNQACHLCSNANSGYFDKRVFLSNVIYNNLNETYKSYCTKDTVRDIYQADMVNNLMNNWLNEQR